MYLLQTYRPKKHILLKTEAIYYKSIASTKEWYFGCQPENNKYTLPAVIPEEKLIPDPVQLQCS